MALKDRISFGISLPHRSSDPIDMASVRRVAERAEVLGFRDLWVTENTLDHVFSLDPMVILTCAAAVTSKIRLGLAVSVLPVHDYNKDKNPAWEVTRRRPPDTSSIARLNELPYEGAGHCNGDPTSRALAVGASGCIAQPATTSGAPAALRAPMPVLAGSGSTRSSAKNAVRISLKSR